MKVVMCIINEIINDKVLLILLLMILILMYY